MSQHPPSPEALAIPQDQYNRPVVLVREPEDVIVGEATVEEEFAITNPDHIAFVTAMAHKVPESMTRVIKELLDELTGEHLGWVTVISEKFAGEKEARIVEVFTLHKYPEAEKKEYVGKPKPKSDFQEVEANGYPYPKRGQHSS